MNHLRFIYSIGNKHVTHLSTPESRESKPKPDNEIVMGLSFLPIPLSGGDINALIRLGSKRLAAMDEVYRRSVDLRSPLVRQSIVRIHLLNSDLEGTFTGTKEEKHKYLKDKGIVDLSLDDVLTPKGNLKQELSQVKDKMLAIRNGFVKLENPKSLTAGLPYFKVMIRTPVLVKGNVLLVINKKDQEVAYLNL